MKALLNLTMAEKDYYKILGIGRRESTEGIRDAFRRLAKKYHPDKAGPNGQPLFHDIMEAYEVLSDPQRRSSYDRTLRGGGRGSGPAGMPPVTDRTPIRPRRFCRERMGTPRHRVRPRLAREADLTVILSQGEAERGGIVHLKVPRYTYCPECEGSGESWFFPCQYCEGQGVVKQNRILRLAIPPMVEDGSLLEVPVSETGWVGQVLRVSIQVC